MTKNVVHLLVALLAASLATCNPAADRAAKHQPAPNPALNAVSKVVLIVDGENVSASYQINTPPGQPNAGLQLEDYFIPGRVIAFRTTMGLPQFQGIGQTGHVYRLDDERQLQEIGTFDVTLSEKAIRDRFGE